MQTNLTTLIAQADAAQTGAGGLGLLIQHLLAALIFSLLGVVILALCVWVMSRLTPFSMMKEIEEDQNTALAIVMGAVLIGMSMIIAAAIRG